MERASGVLLAVAGCPPDDFSATGQLWGNPLYNWDYHKKTGYDWWIKRIRHCFKLYDVVRIDHFRGFDEYYSIPYGNKTAVDGTWMPGPGMELFRTIIQRPALCIPARMTTIRQEDGITVQIKQREILQKNICIHHVSMKTIWHGILSALR